MTGHLGLGFIENIHYVADAELTVGEEHDNPQPDLFRQGSKILNQSVHSSRRSKHYIRVGGYNYIALYA